VTSTPTPDRRRAAYIDWARGLAVLLMIEAHTFDAWTRASSRGSTAFGYSMILAGFAAPLFLWLAGVAIPLAASAGKRRGLTRREAALNVVKRGVEIFILAFVFRLQAFILSPGAHPITLFRVDILNIMGPAIVGAGLAWAAARTPTARVVVFALLAIVFSMVTPIVRASPAVDRLPLWLQWHLRPAGDMTVFTLLPWGGFVFAGAAAGELLAAARDARRERRIHTAIAICGAALILVGFYAAARPSIYASSSFWTSSPTWFAIRVGILMVALSSLYAIEQAAGARQAFDSSASRTSSRSLLSSWQAPLERLGQHSLFIYWIHVELVYGYFSWLWWHRLPLWGAIVGYVLFCALMYRAIEWRDRVLASWRARPRGALLSAASG